MQQCCRSYTDCAHGRAAGTPSGAGTGGGLLGGIGSTVNTVLGGTPTLTPSGGSGGLPVSLHPAQALGLTPDTGRSSTRSLFKGAAEWQVAVLRQPDFMRVSQA